MVVELDDNQLEAIKLLKNGSILCGGVGSGKSRTAIAYYYTKIGHGRIDEVYSPMKNVVDLYIITTAKKRDDYEWESELTPFTLSTNKELNPYNNKIVVDSWNNIKKYIEVENAFFIFDEQRVVGSGAWVKAFLKITQKNRWILLTATPGDTWMDYIPVFVANGFYKNRTEFIKRHVVYSRFSKYPKVDRYLDTGRLIKNRKDILIKMKYVKHTTSHKKIVNIGYDQLLTKSVTKDRWDIFKNEPIQNASDLCYVLRKIANSDPDRIAAVKAIVNEHPRVIIFYNFDYELEILREIGSSMKITTAEFNGHKHESVPTGESWLYLVQYAAGAEGWNCITTDTIIFYSQSYSYKATVQAAGRIDRRNTPYKDLYYYHLKSNAPIDIAIFRALSKKQNFNESGFVNG